MDLVCENESDKSLMLTIPQMFGRLYKTMKGVCWAHCQLSIKLPQGVKTYILWVLNFN